MRGQPAASPARPALVLVLQSVEGLSDRQTADAVRGRIDWKYALGLDLLGLSYILVTCALALIKTVIAAFPF